MCLQSSRRVRNPSCPYHPPSRTNQPSLGLLPGSVAPATRRCGMRYGSSARPREGRRPVSPDAPPAPPRGGRSALLRRPLRLHTPLIVPTPLKYRRSLVIHDKGWETRLRTSSATLKSRFSSVHDALLYLEDEN